MSDYRARLHVEFSELHMRIESLKKFMLSEKYSRLEEVDRQDLRMQCKAMGEYFEILSRRVSRLCK